MSDSGADEVVAAPGWLLYASVAALLWNLQGAFTCVSMLKMSEQQLRKLPKAEQRLLRAFPSWASAAFAMATASGVGGSVLLLLHSAASVATFQLSLAAMLVQFGHWCFASGARAVYGPSVYLMPAMVTTVGAALLWRSMYGKSQGFLH